MVNFYNDKLVKQYTTPNIKEPKKIKIKIRSIQQYKFFLNHKYNFTNVPNIHHNLDLDASLPQIGQYGIGLNS
jgi:hypothetical protein